MPINNQQSTISNHSGFTLIEILVVMVLVAIVITTAGGLFTYSIRMDQKTRTILDVKQIGDNAMSIMVSKIRTAQEINSPPCDVFPSSADEINFRDNDGNDVVLSLDSDRIILDGDYLTGTDVFVESLEFSCFEGNQEVIEIDFTLVKGPGDDPQRDVSLDFMTSVSLRNY